MAVQINKIEKALSLGKTVGATKLLQEYYLAQDKAQYFAGLQAEYDAMYPAMRDMTIEEQLAYDEANFDEMNIKPEEFTYPQVEIEYITTDEEGNEVRTPAEYVTHNEYINETVVVQEAIEAVTEVDEDGFEVIVTPAVAEVTEMVRPFVAKDTTERVNAYIGSKYAELRKAEYPPAEDYLDAVVKEDVVAIDAYKQACLDVKAKYPKPE